METNILYLYLPWKPQFYIYGQYRKKNMFIVYLGNQSYFSIFIMETPVFINMQYEIIMNMRTSRKLHIESKSVS